MFPGEICRDGLSTGGRGYWVLVQQNLGRERRTWEWSLSWGWSDSSCVWLWGWCGSLPQPLMENLGSGNGRSCYSHGRTAEDSWVRTEGSWAPERSQDLGFQQILDWVVPTSLLDVSVVLSFYWLHHFFLHIVWKFLTHTSFRLTPTVLLFFISCFLSTSLLCVFKLLLQIIICFTLSVALFTLLSPVEHK